MATTKGKIKAISISKDRGTRKYNVLRAELKVGFGIVGDAHAGNWHRQVSLLAEESIEKMRAKGASVTEGDFAENITTEGIDLSSLKIGSILKLGPVVEVEITQFGKECHSGCEIFQQIGDCIMPREGVFAKVTKPGQIKTGDVITEDRIQKTEDRAAPLRRKPTTRRATVRERSSIQNRDSRIKNRVAILTVSDSCAQQKREDISGQTIKEKLPAGKFEICEYKVVADEQEHIEKELIYFADEVKVDVVFTTGGTGLGPRDVTPEATAAICAKMIPGIAEAMRMEGLKNTKNAMLSRALVGVRGNTLIVNLPGSPKAVRESLGVVLNVLDHAVDMVAGLGH